MLINPLGILFSPTKQWQSFASASNFAAFIPYLLIMSVLPCAAWYYGTIHTGWQVGDGDTIRLTEQSAFGIAVALYIAILFFISTIGYAIHWMSDVYGSKDSSILKGVGFTALTATPFFILGLVGVYPLLWLDMLLGLVGITWSTYLLYTGLPVALNIPKERGFLYASALLAVILVNFMIILGATTILWDAGIIPVFAD